MSDGVNTLDVRTRPVTRTVGKTSGGLFLPRIGASTTQWDSSHGNLYTWRPLLIVLFLFDVGFWGARSSADNTGSRVAQVSECFFVKLFPFCALTMLWLCWMLPCRFTEGSRRWRPADTPDLPPLCPNQIFYFWVVQSRGSHGRECSIYIVY